MRTTIIHLAITLFIFISSSTSIQGQQKKTDVLKIQYVTNSLSPEMLSILKEKISSPDEYKTTVDRISKFKCFYSLYVNTKTRESIYVLDSIQSVPNIMVVGNIEFVNIDNKNNIIGKEVFMKSYHMFNGNTTDLEWELSNETKIINDFECQKAELKGFPYVVAWFTNDIPLSKGPGYYQGLSGFVLEASDFFSSTEFIGMEYTDEDLSPNLFDKYKKEGKEYSLNEIFKSKANMILLMEK